MEIFVVMGTTGEYSDRNEWPVKAFKLKDSAEAFVLECSKIAKEIKAKYKSSYSVPANSHPLDPGFQSDYTGTEYFIYNVKLED